MFCGRRQGRPRSNYKPIYHRGFFPIDFAQILIKTSVVTFWKAKTSTWKLNTGFLGRGEFPSKDDVGLFRFTKLSITEQVLYSEWIIAYNIVERILAWTVRLDKSWEVNKLCKSLVGEHINEYFTLIFIGPVYTDCPIEKTFVIRKIEVNSNK